MSEMQRIYIPCQCWSADHLVCIDVEPDMPDTLNIAVVSRRNCSLWDRLRWAVKYAFGREDLVFADLIVNRNDLRRALTRPKEAHDE